MPRGCPDSAGLESKVYSRVRILSVVWRSESVVWILDSGVCQESEAWPESGVCLLSEIWSPESGVCPESKVCPEVVRLLQFVWNWLLPEIRSLSQSPELFRSLQFARYPQCMQNPDFVSCP
jgi:hypothetical protein